MNHCLGLHLITVLTPRLRPLDLEFMKRLGRIVNVVPVIAKADTLTLEEREEFKQRVGPNKNVLSTAIQVHKYHKLKKLKCFAESTSRLV